MYLESTTKLLQDGTGNTDLLIRTLDVIEVKYRSMCYNYYILICANNN